MRKVKKTLLLSGLTAITIGIIGLTNINPETLLKGNVSSHVQAYNHNPSNILDNVFEKNSLTILPFIFKDSDQTISKSYLVEQFKKAGLTIQNESTLKGVISTGTQIKTSSKTYTVLIYGDVNSDGYVDVFDSQRIMRHYVYGENNTLTGIYQIAGNVNNNDNEVDVFDSQRILRFYVGFETKLVVNEPASIKETDSKAPVITLKGSNPQTINLGASYVEAGATVTDNVDKNLTVKIDASNINTNKVGTYVVKYTAVDKAGNKTTVTRTVNVVDYVVSLSVTPPTKTEFKFGEELDKSGMIVKATMKSGNIVTINSGYIVSGYNKNLLGKQTITVSYSGKAATFSVNVIDYMTGLRVTPPTKTEYKYDEEIDLSGMLVQTTWKSGALKAIDSGSYTMTQYNKQQLGTQTITVSYEQKTDSFNVTVIDYALNLSAKTTKTEYKYGEELDFETIEVKAIMASGKEEIVLNSDYVVSGYNKEKLGEQIVNISYAGKTQSFNVNVVDYQTGIILKGPDKTTYLYNEELDLSNVTVRKQMASGDMTQEISVTQDMISGYNKEELGEQVVTITYEGYEKTFKVRVNDYALGIQITTAPTKVTYKYEQQLDLTGLVVEVNMAKEGLKQVTDYTISDFISTQLGEQTIYISYAGKETSFKVIVENYITEIEMISIPTKVEYIAGEAVDLSGMVLNKIMKDGSRVQISLQDTKLTTDPIENITFGTISIKVIYKTSETINNEEETFNKSYDVNVAKPLANLNVEKEKQEGYAHEEFKFGTIVSGQDEVILRKEQLKIDVRDIDGNDVTSDFEVSYTELGPIFENKLEIKLKTNNIGIYNVTFYVGESIDNVNTVKSIQQEIELINNPMIKSFDVSILETDKLRIGNSIEKEISFINIHGDKINVNASDISITSDGASIALLDSNGNLTTQGVSKIQIIGNKVGQTSIQLKGKNVSSQINTILLEILDEAKKRIEIGSISDITLLQEEPYEPRENVVVINNVPYALISIQIVDEDGKVTPLYGSSYSVGKKEEKKPLNIQNTSFESKQFSYIDAKLFTSSKVEADQSNEAKYLGVAIGNGILVDMLEGEQVIINYEGTESKYLDIKVEELRIHELNVTPENIDNASKLPTGYNKEEFIIGTIKSGVKQKQLSVQDLYTNSNANYTVKNSLGQDITSKNKVEVIYEYDNLRQEILIKVTTEQPGEYTILPYVMVAGEKIEVEQKIETIKNPEIKTVQMQETSIVVNTTDIRGITFKNKWDEILDVNANDLQITATNAEVVFMDENETPNYGVIRKVQIKGTNAGISTINITKKGETTSIAEFSVKIEELTYTIDLKGTQNIPLYQTDPSLENVKLVDGVLYTLIPVSIQRSDNQEQLLIAKDLADGTLKIQGSTYEQTHFNKIDVKVFKQDKTTAEEQDTVAYIGIAYAVNIGPDAIQNEKVIIEYKTQKITLDIIAKN